MIDLDYIYANLSDLESKEKIEDLSIEIKSAKGSSLFASDGTEYVDFTSNKDSQPLGYSFDSDLDGTCISASGNFVSASEKELEQVIKDLTGLDKVIFTSCSSNAHNKVSEILNNYLESKERSAILLSSSFELFNKYSSNANVERVLINNTSILKTLFSKKVGALVIEIAQISDDVELANLDYLKYAREICDRQGALLIFDVSNISPLRFYEENKGFFNYGDVKPDMLVASKGLAIGFPIGLVALNDQKLDEPAGTEKSDSSLDLAYKLALKFANSYKEDDLKSILIKNSAYMEKTLNQLSDKHISISEVNSYGMLFTMHVDVSAYELAKECLDKGIVVEALNPRIIKISPNYILSKKEVDKLINTLDQLLDKLAVLDRLD